MTKKVKKFGYGGTTDRLEVTGRKPSMMERAVGMAEEYGHGVGIPGIAGSTARSVGMARDLKQKKLQDEIIAKRKLGTPEGKEKIQRVVNRYNAVDVSEEPYKKGGVAKSGKWIQKAIKKPGALKKSLGVKGDKPIPASKLAKAAKAPGKMGQRARLAQTLKKMK